MRSRSDRAGLIRLGLVVSAMAAVAAGACSEPNQFVGPGFPGGGSSTTGEPTVQITDSRSTSPLGDSILVTVNARDGSGITAVSLVGRTLRGDVSLGTEESVQRFEEKVVTLPSSPSDTTISRFLIPTEDTERETTFIVVSATDTEGLVGMDSVAVVLGGPAVRFENLASAQSGTDLPIQVVANDPEGVTSIRVEVTGVLEATLVREFAPARDTARLDTLLFIPQDVVGTLNLVAIAVNDRGIAGQTPTTSIAVTETGSVDLVPPSLSLETDSPDRLEAASPVAVTLRGSDNPGGSGVKSAGITVLAISPTRQDSILRDSVVEFDRARSGTVEQTFSFTPFNVDSLSLPDTLIYEITGFYVDDAGNCGASNGGGVQSLPCEQLTVGGTTGVVSSALSGLRLEREVVAGETVLLPAGGTIMDAAVDTLRRNLFLSNIDANQVEVFRLETEEFANPIAVGSEPWGLDMVTDYSAPDPDSLVVANSNGTNLELIDLDQEVARPEERFFFPDVVLFDVNVELGDAGIVITVVPRPQLALLDFSDRPQFLAVDSFGNRIFSTLVAEQVEQEVGTVRKSFFLDGWEQPETKIFVEHAIFEESDDDFAFAHVDNVFAGGGVITLVDHVLGFPDQQITASADLNFGQTINDAVNALRAQGSDVFFVNGRWNIPSLGFQDTTFVAASGDGTWVAIGEGAAPELGRVLLHEAAEGSSTSLSGNVPVADLITNRPEPVRGIGLNYDGTLGVVRGSSEVAFFDTELRKQGGTQTVDGGAGAALHPLHANQKTLTNLGGLHLPDVHLAFVGTGDGSIDIVDTFRFLRIGSVRIRDVITGPIRAVLPFPEDNEDFVCSTVPVQDKRGSLIGDAVQLYDNNDFFSPADSSVSDDRCVVVKLFAVTDAGGVVVIDVRKADILRFHPQRD